MLACDAVTMGDGRVAHSVEAWTALVSAEGGAGGGASGGASGTRTRVSATTDGCGGRARARAVACACAMTAVFAREIGAVMSMVDADGEAGGRRRGRGARACLARRRNERVGREYWVVVARADAGWGDGAVATGTRTMSFRIDESAGGEAAARRRAAEFTATAAFDAWVRGSKCVRGPKKPGLGGSRTRAKKHPYAYSGIMGDDVIDCACGDNEEYGFMVACETCGAWEHGECCGISSEEEIPKDYKCSSCVRRAEKNLAVLEYVGDEAAPRTNASTIQPPEPDELKGDDFGSIDDLASVLHGERVAVCCICGCEDCDDDYASMVRACSCLDGGAIAHASCVKSLGGGQKGSNARSRGTSRGNESLSCKACDDFGGKASGVTEPSKVDDMLRAFANAAEETAERYEAELMSFRANPRQRRPKNAGGDATVKKEKLKEIKSEVKPKVEKKKSTQTEATPSVTPPTPSTAEKPKSAGTPVSMMPLKKRRLMAWDSERKIHSSIDAQAKGLGLTENVNHERVELTNNIHSS